MNKTRQKNEIGLLRTLIIITIIIFAIKHKKILKFLTIIERHISRMSIGLIASIIDQFSDLQKKKITATLSVKPPIPVHTDSV